MLVLIDDEVFDVPEKVGLAVKRQFLYNTVCGGKSPMEMKAYLDMIEKILTSINEKMVKHDE